MPNSASILAEFRSRQAAGLEPCPTHDEVVGWLQLNSDRIADVVCPPLSDAKKIWFDWSVGSAGSPLTTDGIQTAMDEVGAEIGIGRYCENRDVYQGQAYSLGDESQRTFHLGVDLFAPAGTPVYAVLDGTIEMFNDNAAQYDYGPVIIVKHTLPSGTEFFTLYGHLSRPSLIGLEIGQPVKAGQQIATMGEEFENGNWAPHVHFQLLNHLCDMGVDVYGVAPKNEVALWRSISPDPNLCLRIAEGVDALSAG